MLRTSALAISLAFAPLLALAQDDSSSFSYSIKAKKLGDGNVRIVVVNRQIADTVCNILLTDVYTDHYHPYEFHNGNLYVIHRTGGPDGYLKFPKTWTDSLLKYDAHKRGTRIFTAGGLDFRVSPSEQHIAVVARDKLFLLNNKGAILGEFSPSIFGLDYVDFLGFTKQSLFFTNGGPEASLAVIIKMNLSNYKWTKYKLSDLQFDDDYDFNPNNEMIVGSDWPAFYDSDSFDSWKKKKHSVTLYLYDLRSHRKSVVAISKAKQFAPRWVDRNHFEFNDPKSSKRIIQEVER